MTRTRLWIRSWIPDSKETAASMDAPKLRAIFCRLGLHSPYHKYGEETFLTWAEIKAGKSYPKTPNLGIHCRICDRKFVREIKYSGKNPTFYRALITWVQPL